MRFITENDLRVRFREMPFTEYRGESGTRLTPGARQFLSDRSIRITDNVAGAPQPRAPAENNGATNQNEREQIMSARFEILEAEFLVLASEIAQEEPETAGQITEAGRELGRIRRMLRRENEDSCILFQECTGINNENCRCCLNPCFEITDFHIRSARGKQIARLNLLRAKTKALAGWMGEQAVLSQEAERCRKAAGDINLIANKISQMICRAAEVNKCRRIS